VTESTEAPTYRLNIAESKQMAKRADLRLAKVMSEGEAFQRHASFKYAETKACYRENIE
jgi:hypothetical protein